MTTPSSLRNVAIIAHVDHGKTTLVDKLLAQSVTIDERKDHGERIMDSNDLEKRHYHLVEKYGDSVERSSDQYCRYPWARRFWW